ncbi:sodium:proton antiporter [Hydrogenophaga crassostreae]|uniref:Sodium:proton antiporter n=2 Tax=Hydrogenophaga crassostreae TaxID=1763535 RepID=A0A167HAY6_9BURK|nr:sodium:proton antiporter [Hydrogenophaga crassostreae]OAD40628.1 sodium:proton antiporter [Hydrogenophaga crassostreae]
MSTAGWFLLIGGLLLFMGTGGPLLRRSPATSAIVYLGVGLLFGPTGLGLYHFNPLKESALLELLTEVAVLISLYATGVKMPVPFSWPLWRAPVLLATLSMALTVGLITAFAHWALGLPLGASVLLGAILAPTDPVLATDVQIRHPGDSDQLRFRLSCEAGLNDGSAFPFVVLGLGMLGLHNLGDFGLQWLMKDVLWATAAGIAVGVLAGAALAHLMRQLRRTPEPNAFLIDFLGLGLIGVVYGTCLLIDAWGFLAVFFSAVALRQTEMRLAVQNGTSAAPGSDEATLPAAPTVSGGTLIFKEHLERLSELVLVLLVGGSLFLNSWSWSAVATALFLFLVARPLGVFIALGIRRSPLPLQGMTAWFGVRGIGSLYYLMYAIQHGLPEELALQLVQITLIVITLSILLHGVSVKPLLNRVWQRN